MKKYLFVTLLFTIFPLNVYAISEQEQQNAINNQNILIQRDQQNFQEKIKEKDLQQVEKDQKESEEQEEDYEELKEQEGKVIQDLRALQCFRIKKIIFSENEIIEKIYEENFSKEYLGKCVSIRQISKLSKKISDHLVNEGYVTSRAEIPAQSLSEGILKINVIESYLENIAFNGENFFDRTQKFTAFGFVKKNKILNLKKIEQGLDQVNRLSSNNATIKILPGKSERTSIIAVENNPHKRLRLNASYNNNGNELTGDKRETIGLTQDNLFWLNDNFTLSRTANDLDQTRKKNGGTNALSSSFSVPFKWYNLTLSYSKSSYFFWGGDVSRFKSSGDTATKTASLDRILLKNKKVKLSSNLALTSRYSQNFVDDVKVQVSSRKASIASLGLSNTFFLDNSTLFLKPSYSKAINILDAQKDAPNLSSNSSHAEFDMFEFYGNYAKKSQVFDTPISYNFSFDSQVSEQTLYGIDKFSIGGISSIRGFKEGTISGDSGYNFRNEASVNFGQMILPYLSDEKSQSLTQLNRFSISPFYDYGQVRAKNGQTSGRLSGGGFKIGFNHKNFNAALTFSRALSKSKFLGQHYSDNNAIFFNISSELGFF